MASIRGLGPDGGPPYKITIKRGGQRWYFTRDTLREAQRVAGVAEDDLDHGRDPYERYEVRRTPPPRGTLLCDWAATWLAAQDMEESTRANAERNIGRHILPAFGHLEVAEIRHIAVQAWLSRLRRERLPRTGRPPAPGTIAKIWGTFAQMMAAAEREGLIERDPCAGLTVSTGPGRRDARHYISPADTLALADAMARPRPRTKGRSGGVTPVQLRNRLFTITLRWTGCRWSELAGLRRSPDEVQLLRKPPAIIVAEPVKYTGRKGGQYHGQPKTPASRRTVELIQPLADQLAAWMAHGRPYVFASEVGKPTYYRDYYDAFKEAAGAVGHPEWTVHDLRHSLITDLRRCDRRAVQEYVGHGPRDVTDGYIHVQPEDRAEILVVLDGLWRQAHEAAATEAGEAG